MKGLKTYAIHETLLSRSGRMLLDLMWRIERDFWLGAFNGGLLILCLGWAGFRWLRQGDATGWWLLLQLSLIPALMAVEEFLHLMVMARKNIRPDLIDLVMVYHTGRRGFPWWCCGTAVRLRGKVSSQSRIHIAVPGPALSLVLMAPLWLACGLLDRHPWWGRAHLTALPALSYLAGSWIPLPAALRPDVVVMLRAGRAAGYPWMRTLRECLRGLRFVWSQREAGEHQRETGDGQQGAAAERKEEVSGQQEERSYL